MTEMNVNSKIDSHWLNWCRLCAKDAARNVKLYFNNDKRPHTGNWDNIMVMAIRKYFEVHMRSDDELSSMLCTECYTLISELIDFAEHVNKVQAIFEVLRRTNPRKQLDVAALRQRYGLREGDWTHIIKSTDCEAESENMDNIEHNAALQEFVDLSASFNGEVVIEIAPVAQPSVPNNHAALEELAFVSYNKSESSIHNPVKRSRGRPRGSSVKKLNTNASVKNAHVLPKTQYKSELNCATSMSESLVPSGDSVQECLDDLNSEMEFMTDVASSASPVGAPSESIDISASNATDLISNDVESSPSEKSSPLACKFCGKTYQNTRSGQKNKGCRRVRCILSRPKLDQNTTCEICNKKLSSVATLRLHMDVIHKNATPYICDSCGKALKTSTALNEHKLVHTEERPFVCNICNAGFKNKARLNIHSQIHREPSYVCNICGKKLQTRRTWNMHKLVHSEERKLKCDVCGAGFKRSKTLKTHLLSHTGLRPYVCNYCGKSFSCNSNCRAHMQKQHSKEVKLDGGLTRLNVPTLKELRVMSQKLANEPDVP